MIVSIRNSILYFSTLSRWPAPLRSASIRLSHVPMPARRLVYEYSKELKHAALLHMALDYQRRAITHRPTWYISRTSLTACCCNRCGHHSHGEAAACRRTYITYNTLTTAQPKPTGTELRAIIRTEASDRFRRHCEWFSWWTFYKKKDVHYGKYSSAKLYYIVFIDYCQSRVEQNNSKIKLNCRLDKSYSRTQPIVKRTKFSHDGPVLIVI